MRFMRFVAPIVFSTSAVFAQAPPTQPAANPPTTSPATRPGSPLAPGTPATTRQPSVPATGTVAPGTPATTRQPSVPATGPIAPGTPATTRQPSLPMTLPGTTAAPGTPGTTLTAPTPIFRMDSISQALTLNRRQLNQLNTMTQQLQQRYQVQYDRLNRLPANQRTNRLMELNREYNNSWLNGAKNFLDPTQLSRYQQLQLQSGGFATFNDPAIQKGLNLTDPQIKQLNSAQTNSNKLLQEILTLGQTDPAQAQRAYVAFTRAYQDQLTQILTPEQQRQWSQMTGEPFPFPPPPFGTGGTVPPKQ